MGGQAAMGLPYTPVKNYQIPEKGVEWFGEPIGMNINGDIFYMAFCKDGMAYKINDFVYLAPEESNENPQAAAQSHDPSQDGSNPEHMNAPQPVMDNQGAIDPSSVMQNNPSEQESQLKEKVEQKQEDQQQGSEQMVQEGVQKQEGEDEEDFEFDVSAASGAPETYWICKIINLVATKTEGMKLIGQWFYRWCDIQGFGVGIDAIAKDKSKKQYLFQKEKEVFVSFDLNYNSLSTVRGKCYVKFMDQEMLKKNRKSLLKPHHYYFSQGFNRLRSEFFELPDTMLKIMRETTNEDEDADPIQSIQQQMIAHQTHQLAALASSMPMGQQMGMMPGMGMGAMMGAGDPTGVNSLQNDWATLAAMQQMQQVAPQDHMHEEAMHHHHHHQ